MSDRNLVSNKYEVVRMAKDKQYIVYDKESGSIYQCKNVTNPCACSFDGYVHAQLLNGEGHIYELDIPLEKNGSYSFEKAEIVEGELSEKFQAYLKEIQ